MYIKLNCHRFHCNLATWKITMETVTSIVFHMVTSLFYSGFRCSHVISFPKFYIGLFYNELYTLL